MEMTGSTACTHGIDEAGCHRMSYVLTAMQWPTTAAHSPRAQAPPPEQFLRVEMAEGCPENGVDGVFLAHVRVRMTVGARGVRSIENDG